MIKEQPPRSCPADHWSDYEAQWRSQAILSDAVLELVHRLNQEYLQFLARSPRQWTPSSGGSRLPDPLCTTLMALSNERRTEIARCPFVLFAARFNDHAFWSQAVTGTTVADGAGGAPPYVQPARAETFAQAALLFAWHVVHLNAIAASLVLGMSPRTVQVFTALSLPRVLDLAWAYPHVVTLRWPERADFWQELLAVPPETVRKANKAHLLGLQVLAAEVASDGD
jgi:hypothetical protein